MKRELIAMLEAEGIRYSLTATIAKDVNDDEIPSIADFFFSSKAFSLMFNLWPSPARPTTGRFFSASRPSCASWKGGSFPPRPPLTSGTVLRSVFIHGFMHAATFDLSRIMNCCNHYLQPDGRLIPMCVHNVVGEGREG